MFKRVAALVGLAMVGAAPLRAQVSTPAAPPAPVAAATGSTRFCGQAVPAPSALPPANSGPVGYLFGPCFEAQGGESVIEPETYLYYIQLKPSQPSQGNWTTYDETTEKTILEDFHRLWNTNFLDNLSIDVSDYTFSNGVIGKMVTYNMEERQRLKIGPDFTGTKQIDTTKVDEKLKELNLQMRLDSFLDAGLIKKVAGVVQDMMKEKGFQNAEVTPEIKELPGGPKLVHLTYNIDEGPKIKIRSVDFIGNTAFSDSTLQKR